jgi:hypothetical protein
MNKKYLIFGIVFLMMISLVNAVTIREKMGQGGTNNINIGYSKATGGYYWQGGQSFSLNGTGQYNISNVNFTLQRVGSPTDKIFVRIEHNTTGNVPNVINSTITNGISNAISGLSTTMTSYMFTFNTTPILNKSQGYWFVIQRTGAVSSTNYYNIRRNSASQTYTEGKSMALEAYTWLYYLYDFEGTYYYSTYTAPVSDTCTYSGTGNWIMTNNCNISSTTSKVQSGYTLIMKGTGKTLKISGTGLIR